ncbi:MAG: L-rhamnose isomerase [Treponema sp.]|nr:L-rhamnose isomerase [Treponema sp.]
MNPIANKDAIEQAYALAKESYKKWGVDTDAAIKQALDIPVSMQCWQGDDVIGFEGADTLSGGGILTTGNYPGRARNGNELRQDAEFAFSLIPGKKRFNLHTFYAEPGTKVARDELEPEHFSKWMAWSKEKNIPLDFNPSFFAHPMAEAGYTLASADPKVRDFWVRHGKLSRKIAAAMGANQGSPCVNNIWACDGSKDSVADRISPRLRLKDALDEILDVKYDANTITDAVESKLFGIGSEAYVPGSHDFYLGYAASRQIRLCLDMGHFHPTENIADKISSVLLFVPGLLMHFSRGVRWDSDHVPTYTDDLRDTCREIIRQDAFNRIDLSMDFFDASLNRIAAWTIGCRNLRLALLNALLEPTKLLVEAENAAKFHERLGLMEAVKVLPVSAVWDKLCLDAEVPVSTDWFKPVSDYEASVLLKR